MQALATQQELLPQKPDLKASLKRLVADRENGTTGDSFWLCPKTVTPEERENAIAYLRAVREAYPSPSPEWLGGRIATLLAHYWQDMPGDNELAKVARRMISEDWMQALDILPQAALDKAISWWRDNETRKPKPADIRRIAIDKFGARKWEELMRVRKLVDVPVEERAPEPAAEPYRKPTPEERGRVAQLMHENFCNPGRPSPTCGICSAGGQEA